MKFKAAVLVLIAALASPALAQASSPRLLYTRALAQERTLRLEAARPTPKQLRAAIARYEAVVRQFPASAYSDNALWQAANLALLCFERFGEPSDKRMAARL